MGRQRAFLPCTSPGLKRESDVEYAAHVVGTPQKTVKHVEGTRTRQLRKRVPPSQKEKTSEMGSSPGRTQNISSTPCVLQLKIWKSRAAGPCEPHLFA